MLRISRIVLTVAALGAAAVAGAARMWMAAGGPPVRLRLWVFTAIAVDAALLWGVFERRAPLFGRIVARGRPVTPAIAVTFDDGPTEPYTSQILDALKAFGAPATFFVLGVRAAAAPDTVRRAAAEGHEIGNHGWDHEALPLHGPRYLRDTIRRTSDEVARVTGQRPSLFRAPFGWRNPWVNAAARREGCEPVAWTLGVYDTDRPGAARIAQRAIDGLRDGTVLLLHDGRSLDPAPDASQVVAALPEILRAANARGFRLLTMSALLAETRRRPWPDPARG